MASFIGSEKGEVRRLTGQGRTTNMKSHFLTFARYNHWANARLYEAVFAIDEQRRRRDIRLFFGSLHGTLNHLLVTDRIWLFRLTGSDPETGPLSKIIHDRSDDLVRARIVADQRIIALVEDRPEEAFDRLVVYQNTKGERFEQPLSTILAHLFNHQTHHRGQAHAALSQLTGEEPPSLDLMGLHRGVPAPDMAKLLAA